MATPPCALQDPRSSRVLRNMGGDVPDAIGSSRGGAWVWRDRGAGRRDKLNAHRQHDTL